MVTGKNIIFLNSKASNKYNSIYNKKVKKLYDLLCLNCNIFTKKKNKKKFDNELYKIKIYI